MTSKQVIGIDPGRTGAAVVVSVETLRPLKWFTFDVGGPWGCLDKLTAVYNIHELTVFIEKVGASPQMGVVSAFSFGKSFGELLGYLAAYEVFPTQVAPQTWQTVVDIPAKLDEPAKERTRRWVESRGYRALFTPPACRVPHSGLMDAYGIAVYGAKVLAGEIEPPNTEAKKPRRRAISF